MTAQEVADAQRYERAKVVLDKVSPDSKGKQGVAAADPKWSGRGYNPKTGGVIVWRVGADQDQAGDARYRALATADVPVEVRPALVSHDDYQRIRDALADDLAKVGGPAKVDIPVRGINIEHNAEVLDGATPGRVEIYVLPGKLTPELEEFILATYVDPVLDRSKAVVLEKEMDTPSSLNAAAAMRGKR
jgi:hypothetical protein